MFEHVYRIAGVSIGIHSCSESVFEFFHRFEYTGSDSPEVLLTITPFDNNCSCHGVIHHPLTEPYRHIMLSSTVPSDGFLLADENWICQRFTGRMTDELMLSDALTAGIYSRIALLGGLLMHASAVIYKGQAVIFTAPSGTGKTTQAELWNKHLGAEILNGDKVFFRAKDGAMHAWGSPWKGSSPYVVNKSAPVAAIVVLSQAKENTLRRHEGTDALSRFVPHVFFPNWDEVCVSAVMDTLDRMTTSIPVFSLACRPDREAVMLLHDALDDIWK